MMVVYGASFLCLALLVIACLPSQPAVRFPDNMEGVGLRRNPVLFFLRLVGRLVPFSGRRDEGLRTSLIYTGSRLTVGEFLGVKVLAAMGGMCVSAIVLNELGIRSPVWLILAGVTGFFAPDVWLRSRIAKRQRAILRLMPEVIDLLSLCIGAGLDFLGALSKVVAIAKFKREPLIEELSITLHEIKLGKRRTDALKAMAKRLNINELSSFVRMFVQAERMGTPIVEVLAVHAEDVRLQRFMRADRAALKAPIKLLIPLIFCIMPCVALVVGGPIFIQFFRENPFAK